MCGAGAPACRPTRRPRPPAARRRAASGHGSAPAPARCSLRLDDHPIKHCGGLQIDDDAHDQAPTGCSIQAPCGRSRLPGRRGRPPRRRSRGSAARSSCRARRPTSWPPPAGWASSRPSAAAATWSVPNSEFDDVSEPVTATPSQPMIDDRNGSRPGRAGDPLAERDRLAREVHHVGQREHRGDGQDRPPQLGQRAHERAHVRGAGLKRRHDHGQQAGDQQQRARRVGPAELEGRRRRRPRRRGSGRSAPASRTRCRGP